MQKPASPAIYFLPEGFEPGGNSLVGRVVGNRSFLQGLIKHGGMPALHGYTQHAAAGEAFKHLARALGAGMPVHVIE
jgi:hypothetical protein